MGKGSGTCRLGLISFRRVEPVLFEFAGSADNLLLEGVVDPIDVDSKDLKAGRPCHNSLCRSLIWVVHTGRQ